jgi:hypothetical protein
MSYNPRKFKSLYQQFREDGKESGTLGRQYPSPERIVDLFNNNPQLRLFDEMSNIDIAQMAIADSDDPDAQEILSFIIDLKHQESIVSNDAFYGNYWSPGSVIYPDDFIKVGKTPNGEEVGFTRNQIRRNMLFVGPTGSGKTTALKESLSNPKLLKHSCVVAFCKKPELSGIIELTPAIGQATAYRLGEFPLIFAQGPDNMTDIIWSNELCKTFGHCYERLSAHRYMDIKLCELLRNRPSDSYPTLQQLIKHIEGSRPQPFSREAQYKESVLFCLSDLSLCLGNCTEYSYSNFMEIFFSTPGLKIIEVETLAQEHLSYVASFFMRWIYCKKLYSK